MDRSASTPWITTPAARAGVVCRPRIDELLDRACSEAPVVAVVAGAGYGKTTALAAWARRVAATRPLAWVDAGMAARAPGGLWCALDMACHHALGERDIEAGEHRDGEAGYGPRELLELIARHGDELTLVLDDLHEVRDRTALDALDLLVAYLPAPTRLVVASRWDPPLRLGDLRLGGRLAELRTRDLAFDAAEAQLLVTEHDLVVDHGTVRRLVEVADGWPVALRLAVTAIAGGSDVDASIDQLAGREGLLARYLASEVFGRLPDDWREVVVTAGIVERCHPGLAVALTDVPDAGTMLEQVAADTGLFHPVPGAPGWLEAHPLARAFLRVELEAARAGSLGELHHRAALWFAEHGDWGNWIEHAVHDPDLTCLQQVVARVGVEPLLRSTPDGQQVAAGIVRTVPVRWPLGRPLALAVAVLAHADARTALGLSQVLRDVTFDDPSDERLRVVAMARVWRNCGRHDLAAAALRAAPRHGASADELLLLRGEAVLAGGDGGDYASLRRQALEVLAQASATGADRLMLHLHVALAALSLIEGRPVIAREHADAASLLAVRFGQDLAIPRAEVLVVRTAAALELGEREQLCWSGLTPLSSAVQHGPIHLRLAATGLDLHRRWRDGAHPDRLLHELSTFVRDIDLSRADPGFVLSVAELELRLAEAVQDLGRAQAAVQRLPDRVGALPDAALLRAHLHRLRRAHAHARRELQPVISGAATPLWPAAQLRFLVLDAILAGLQGASDTASLERAVATAASHGRKRPFLELGADALHVLVARRNALPGDERFVDDLIAELESMAPSTRSEVLTEAELRVLHRLASMATLQEIAEGLHLSRNTVKTHTASIYRKLAVGTRRQAVARGHELGLLRST